MFKRPGIDRNPKQAKITGPNRDPEVIDLARIRVGLAREGDDLTGHGDEFIRVESEIAALISRFDRVPHEKRQPGGSGVAWREFTRFGERSARRSAYGWR